MGLVVDVQAKGMRFERFDQPFGITSTAMDVDDVMDEIRYDAASMRVVVVVSVRELSVSCRVVVEGIEWRDVAVVVQMFVKCALLHF